MEGLEGSGAMRKSLEDICWGWCFSASVGGIPSMKLSCPTHLESVSSRATSLEALVLEVLGCMSTQKSPGDESRVRAFLVSVSRKLQPGELPLEPGSLESEDITAEIRVFLLRRWPWECETMWLAALVVSVKSRYLELAERHLQHALQTLVS